jgi:glycosyltransferase involved in cell wall biosynthesis/putative flippase GtrA
MDVLEQRAPADPAVVDVEIVIPVYNEEADLAPSVQRLHDYLTGFPFSWLITIADNASTDSTWPHAIDLAATLPGVRAVHLDAKGRGRALREVWSASTARVVGYMDVDLSTDLSALLPLVAPLISEHSDVAIGSRLSRTSRVVRGPKREFVSRCYNLLLHTALRARFSDAQCGFKAMRTEVARALLPYVQDAGWFFDTELLVVAERSGMRIHEVPVDWIDDADSRVDIVSTAIADLRGIARLGRALAHGDVPLSELRQQLGRHPLSVPGVPTSLVRQAVRFAAIGVASTLAYLLLFLMLRAPLGAQPANLVALLVTAIANTSANRAFTFGVRGAGHARHQVQGLVVFLLGLALTSGALAMLSNLSARPPRAVEVAVLIFANLAATVLKFVLFREWVFAARRSAHTTSGTPTELETAR